MAETDISPRQYVTNSLLLHKHFATWEDYLTKSEMEK